jgi:hypothetical protein
MSEKSKPENWARVLCLTRGLQKQNLDADLPYALPSGDPPKNKTEPQAETAEETKTNRTSRPRETDSVSRKSIGDGKCFGHGKGIKSTSGQSKCWITNPI